MSGFKAATPAAGFYHVTDSSQHDYYFDACGAITLVTCTGSATTSPAALQTWGSPAPQPPTFPQESCAGLGSFAAQSCHSKNASDFTCDYANGDGGRTLSFNYQCAPIAAPPTATQPDPSVNHYVIIFKGPSACAGSGGKGGGWGTLFLILFPVFSGLYVAGGYGYNYKYRDLRGVEAFPQREYWSEVPGLVKDGENASLSLSLSGRNPGSQPEPCLIATSAVSSAVSASASSATLMPRRLARGAPHCSLLPARSSLLTPHCSLLPARSSLLTPPCSLLPARSSLLTRRRPRCQAASTPTSKQVSSSRTSTRSGRATWRTPG